MTHAAHLHTAETSTFVSAEVLEIYSKTQAKDDAKETAKLAKSNADSRNLLPTVYNPISIVAVFVEAHTAKVSDIKNFLKEIQKEEFLKIFSEAKRQEFLNNLKEMEAYISSLNDSDLLMNLSGDKLQKIKDVVLKFKQINPTLNLSIATEKNQLLFKEVVADRITNFDNMLFNINILKNSNGISNYETDMIANIKKIAAQAGLDTTLIDQIPQLCNEMRKKGNNSTELSKIAHTLREAYARIRNEERIAAGLSDFYGLTNERINFIAENLEEVKRFLASNNSMSLVIHEIIKQVKNKGGDVKIDTAYLARYNRICDAFGEQMKNHNPTHLAWIFSVIIPKLNIKNIEDLMKEPNRTFINNAIKTSGQFSSITKDHTNKAAQHVVENTKPQELKTVVNVADHVGKQPVIQSTPAKSTTTSKVEHTGHAKKVTDNGVKKIDFFKKENHTRKHSKKSKSLTSKKEYEGRGLTAQTKEQDKIRRSIAKEGLSSRHRSSDSSSGRSR